MDDDQSTDMVGQNPFDDDDEEVAGDNSMNPFMEEDGGLLFC